MAREIVMIQAFLFSNIRTFDMPGIVNIDK